MPPPLRLVATAVSYHFLKAKPDQAKKPREEMFDPASRNSIKSSPSCMVLGASSCPCHFTHAMFQ